MPEPSRPEDHPAEQPAEPLVEQPAEGSGTPPAVELIEDLTGKSEAELRRWVAPYLLPVAILAVVLSLGGIAYAAVAFVGATLHGDGRSAAQENTLRMPRSATRTVSPSDTPSASPTPTPTRTRQVSRGEDRDRPYRGALVRLRPTRVGARCTERPAYDAAGHRVRYGARNTVDGRARTAWRCPGTAIGQTLHFRVPRHRRIAAVGLLPGYAKTDPRSHVDRYAQDNRITRVRWTLPDGRSYVQRLRPSKRDRTLRQLRVPPSRGGRVLLRILAVKRGPMNSTAISTVRISRPR